ncbi:MAG: phosphocholine cytidylyltransferase family protein [Bacteroidaceae bacterium]|nr:phosphocholine cytidylyltransferase family protein [Bacteroidaceae bacterium]
MIAIILAAGMATRLRPLTNDRPKCLLQVGSRCLLQRLVDGIKSAGLTEVVVVTGYRAEMIRDFINEHYPELTVHFIHNADFQTTNNIYSLWLTREYIEGQDAILMDSDILMDPLLLQRMLQQKVSSLALNRHELGEEEIKVVVDEQMNIVELNKTCDPESAIGESVGVELMLQPYTTALFPELEKMMIEEQLENVFYERAFERLIPQGQTFKVVDTTDLFSIELDTVEDFQNAQRLIPKELF